MHHGLDNIYIYAVTKIEIVISNETEEKIISGTGFFLKKIAEFAIILELNGYSDCSEIG